MIYQYSQLSTVLQVKIPQLLELNMTVQQLLLLQVPFTVVNVYVVAF